MSHAPGAKLIGMSQAPGAKLIGARVGPACVSRMSGAPGERLIAHAIAGMSHAPGAKLIGFVALE